MSGSGRPRGAVRSISHEKGTGSILFGTNCANDKKPPAEVMIVPWLPVDSDDSAEAAAARTRPRPDIPKPYHSATTPLSVEVTANGPNVFDFELATEDGRPSRETTGQK